MTQTITSSIPTQVLPPREEPTCLGCILEKLSNLIACIWKGISAFFCCCSTRTIITMQAPTTATTPVSTLETPRPAPTATAATPVATTTSAQTSRLETATSTPAAPPASQQIAETTVPTHNAPAATTSATSAAVAPPISQPATTTQTTANTAQITQASIPPQNSCPSAPATSTSAAPPASQQIAETTVPTQNAPSATNSETSAVAAPTSPPPQTSSAAAASTQARDPARIAQRRDEIAAELLKADIPAHFENMPERLRILADGISKLEAVIGKPVDVSVVQQQATFRYQNRQPFNRHLFYVQIVAQGKDSSGLYMLTRNISEFRSPALNGDIDLPLRHFHHWRNCCHPLPTFDPSAMLIELFSPRGEECDEAPTPAPAAPPASQQTTATTAPTQNAPSATTSATSAAAAPASTTAPAPDDTRMAQRRGEIETQLRNSYLDQPAHLRKVVDGILKLETGLVEPVTLAMFAPRVTISDEDGSDEMILRYVVIKASRTTPQTLLNIAGEIGELHGATTALAETFRLSTPDSGVILDSIPDFPPDALLLPIHTHPVSS